MAETMHDRPDGREGRPLMLPEPLVRWARAYDENIRPSDVVDEVLGDQLAMLARAILEAVGGEQPQGSGENRHLQAVRDLLLDAKDCDCMNTDPSATLDYIDQVLGDDEIDEAFVAGFRNGVETACPHYWRPWDTLPESGRVLVRTREGDVGERDTALFRGLYHGLTQGWHWMPAPPEPNDE